MPETVESRPQSTSAMTVKSEVWPAGRIKPDPRNARKHSDAQIEAIRGSIQEFGFVAPLIVAPDGMLIGGHATFEAGGLEGMAEFDVRVVSGLSDKQRIALGLALNRLPESSKWDKAALAEALQSIGDDDLIDAAGFTSAEVRKLIGEAAEIEVEEIATGPVDDEFWISIRGPLKHQAELLRALREAAAPLVGVSVDLGTIAVDE